MEPRLSTDKIAEQIRKLRDESSNENPGGTTHPIEPTSKQFSFEGFTLGTSLDEDALVQFVGTPNKLVISTRYQAGIKALVSVSVNNIKAVPGETIVKLPDGQFAVIKNP